MSFSNQVCHLHGSQAVALNLSPNIQWQDSLLCIHCLTANQICSFVRTNEEVKDLLEYKKSYQTLAQLANQELIVSNLQKLKEQLNDFKIDLNGQLDTLINNISSQIQSQGQLNEQPQYSLQEEINSLKTPIKYDDKWLQKIEENLQNIFSKSRTDSCLDLVQDLRKELMSSCFEVSLRNTQKIKELEPYRTPHLDCACQKHNKEIIMIDMAATSKQRLCCVECQPQNFWSLSKFQEQWEALIDERRQFITSEINQKQEMIEKLGGQIKLIEEKLQQSPNTISQLFLKSADLIKIQLENAFVNQNSPTTIEPRAHYMASFQQKQIQLIQEEYQQVENQQFQLIIKEFETLRNIAQDFFFTIKSAFKRTETNREGSFLDLDFQMEILDKQQTNQIENFLKDIDISAIQHNSYIKYEVINTYDQQEVCHAIAFNYDGTIMINGCQDEIIVSQFDNGIVKECSVLKGHNNQVVSLCFGQNNDQFFSGSTDKTIINWQRQSSDEWVCAQVLCGHKRIIDCILFNRKENQLISCSSDKSIRVWGKNQAEMWGEAQILLYHKAYVRCISLNKSQTKLVSCSEDKSVIIWALDNLKQWKLHQILQSDDYGYRISFINDSMIAWQTRNKGTMIVFKYFQATDTFKQANEDIQLNKNNDGYQNFFPSIYNDERRVLINKHGRHVYIIRLLDETKFRIDQVIDVGHYCNYGALTPDGNYLVIWDEGSKQMSVRKAI